MSEIDFATYDFATYGWATLLILASILAWTTNFLSLPGNWLIVAFAALFVLGMDIGDAASGLNWQAVILLAAIAAGGEIAEFAAGAAGASKQGGSRRAIVLSIVGTIVGSIFGAFIALPIPILGPLIGALAGGAGGAFAGAYLGEMWKHGRSDQSLRVGAGAAVGRVIGTLVKVLFGAAMLIVLAFRAFSS